MSVIRMVKDVWWYIPKMYSLPKWYLCFRIRAMFIMEKFSNRQVISVNIFLLFFCWKLICDFNLYHATIYHIDCDFLGNFRKL